ncbi:MAG: cysteine desulfurase NifS [Acidobacteriota bacterium]
MARIYLDNNATSPLDPQVLEAMLPYLREHFGNPSSVHQFGQTARKAVEEAREAVAAFLHAHPEEIVFTSGGTEADNTALLGVAAALRTRGRHVVTGAAEHPAVLRSAEVLEQRGFDVTYLRPAPDGTLEPEAVLEVLRDDTILVSLMAANNETGVCFPVEKLGPQLRARGIVFHTDAVQAAGKIPVDVEVWQVDLLSLSAHKFHGPKGVGALYVRRGTPLEPYLLGGGQERGLRGGTHNTAGIVGLGRAVQLAAEHLEVMSGRVRALRDRLEQGLQEKIPETVVNGATTQRLPHVSNLSFLGAHGESLMISLDLEGIAVSTGAACHSGTTAPSHVLTAMGLPEQQIQGAVRFSLSRFTTEKEVEEALEIVPRVVRRLREAAGLRFF